MRIYAGLLTISIFAILGLTALHSPKAFADNSFERQLKSQPMDFKHYTTEQGLSQANVFAMLQDKAGFMWFGTDDGLNKFDGNTFKVYKNDPTDPESISNNQIIDIVEDADGILWIATYRGGLNKFNPTTGKFAHFQYNSDNPNDPKGLSQENINALKLDNEGYLWIGTNHGLDKMDRSLQTFTHYLFNEEGKGNADINAINALAADEKGFLWLGTSAGLIRFDRMTSKFISYHHKAGDAYSISEDNITALSLDQNQDLWIGTQNTGVNRFNRTTEKIINFTSNPFDKQSLSENKVNVIYSDTLGNIWVGNDKALEQWEATGIGFKHILNDMTDLQSLNGQNILKVYEDRQHDLWVATEKGLNLYSPKNMVKYRAEDAKVHKLLNNSVFSFYEAKNGLIWIGTSNGLQTFDRETGSFNAYSHDPNNPQSVSNGLILSLFEDNHGTIWAGSVEGGLNRYNPDSHTFTRFNDVPQDQTNTKKLNVITKISQYNDHQLWIASFSGLFLFDIDQGEFSRFPTETVNNDEPLFNQSRFTSIIQDKNGATWFGTLDSGLYKWDTTANRIIHYPIYPKFSNNLASNSVSMIQEDQQGMIWAGTKGGLEKFDPQTGIYELFTEKDGLPNNLIGAVLEDNYSGNLWLSTSNGLSQFNPKTKVFHNYDQNDGLQSNEFQSRSFLKTKDGDIFFGGNNGFNWIRPSLMHVSSFNPPLVITSFKVFDQPRTFDRPLTELKKIQLSYKENFFSLEFASLDFRNPARIQYAYKLDGFDKDWVYSNKRRYASYMNLNGGHYILHVKATNSDGDWNTAEKTMELEVIPALWQRWWAYVIYVLFALALAIYYLRLRTKKEAIKLQQQEKLLHQELRQLETQMEEADRLFNMEKLAVLGQLAAGIAHEIRNPLTVIEGFMQIMRKTDLEQEKRKNYLELMHTEVKRINELVSEFLMLSKPEPIKYQRANVYDFLKSMLEFMFSEASLHNIEISYDFDGKELFLEMDIKQMKQVLMNVIKNAIEASYSGGQIRMEVIELQEHVEIVVSDQGGGIPEEILRRIFDPFFTQKDTGTGLGLTTSLNIVRNHQGDIDVKSTMGEGTFVTITLPLTKKVISA